VTLAPGLAAILTAIAGRLIPADEHGPGAEEAGAAAYAARELAARAASRSLSVDWLVAVDRCAVERFGDHLFALDAERQDAVLAAFERGAARTGRPDEAAGFALVRDLVLEGMFGDPAWGGNRDRAGWALLGYSGPRLTWTAAEQELDALPR
jgi:hypothetical protein